MTIDFRTGVIAATFAAQIVTISFMAPARFRRYFTLLFERYPPGEFPRLYPVSQERMRRQIAISRVLYYLVGIGGAVVFARSVFYLDDAIELAHVMFWYLVVQYVPLIFRLSWAISVARAFRAMPPPSVRTADLRQWRAVDFVSPPAIGLGLCGSVLGLACAALGYMRSTVDIGFVVISVLVNGWLLYRMLYVLFTPVTFGRTDPYMSQADVFQARRRRFRFLFRGGGCLGAYFAFMLLYVAGVVRFDAAYLLVGVSLICQALFFVAASKMLRALESRDFSVYRAESHSPLPTERVGSDALTDMP